MYRLPFHIHSLLTRMLTLAACLLATASYVSAAPLTFEGTDPRRTVIDISPAGSTGLETVYVIWNTTGVQAHYTATSSATVRWYRFSSLGGGYAEEVASYHNGTDNYINLTEEDMGYIVEEGTTRRCFWIVNYANHRCSLGSLDILPDQTECDRVALKLDGSAPKITYYSINGAPQTLSRELKLEYNSLVYNEERHTYEQQMIEETLESAEGALRTASPLCSTYFSLSGDRFLHQWNMEEHAVSPVMEPMAIAVTTTAEQEERSNDNEQSDDRGDAMGGSGPVTITFDAAVTDAVVYREWQFARDQDFDIIDLRIQQDEVERTFNDYGTTYIRFVAGNDNGSCDYTSETYTVYIGESRLECPNAFSPGSTEGTNDEWKVSYRSIVSFDCSIFNRWGQLMAHLTDPAQGWDGRYKGKIVPSGVYYYVIRAKGTDGHNYKLSGDINILKFTDNRTPNSVQ